MNPQTAVPIVDLPIERIRILNPRTRNRAQHQAIVNNIAAVGLKRPVTVSRHDRDDGAEAYDLVCGEGRIEAVQKLGHARIPALVVDQDEQECLVCGLVENVARCRHTTRELLSDVRRLRETGYSDDAIATKVGLSDTYIHDILLLLDQGEERLLDAVERGTLPVGLAIIIARSSDADVQRALAAAYAEGTLKGRQLTVVRRLIQKRIVSGITLRASSSPPNAAARKLTSEEVKKLYMKESTRQRVQVKRADVTHAKLAVLLKILSDLLSDAEFVGLLRQHGFVSLPKALDDRIKGNAP
jgi:ParB family chromosome partitioning protein